MIDAIKRADVNARAAALRPVGEHGTGRMRMGDESLAQTIEQGLGRGVRSGEDYCVVLLCGSQLVRFVGVKDRLNLFSPETKQQFLIGQENREASEGRQGHLARKATPL